MSLSQIRRRVDTLKRKLAVSLAVVQLRPIAEDFCNEWALAVFSGKEPPPVTHANVKRIPVASTQPDPAAPPANAFASNETASSNQSLAPDGHQAKEAPKEKITPTFILPRTGNPRPKPLIKRIVDAGFRVHTFIDLTREIDRCRNGKVLPQPNEILRTLLPKAAVFGLIPASPPEVAY